MKAIHPFITVCMLFAIVGHAQMPSDTLTRDTMKTHRSQDSLKIRTIALDTLSPEDIRKIHKQNHPKNPGNHPISTPIDSSAEEPERPRKRFWPFRRKKHENHQFTN